MVFKQASQGINPEVHSQKRWGPQVPDPPVLHGSILDWWPCLLVSVHHHWNALLQELPLLIAFHHQSNLKDILVQTNLNSIPHEPPGNCLCEAARSKTCPILFATDEFSSLTAGENCKMKINAFTTSSNIVYLIRCRRSGQQCLGKTGQPLHRRINSHQYNITHRRTDASPMAEHFNRNLHSQIDMVIKVIDLVWSRDPCL